MFITSCSLKSAAASPPKLLVVSLCSASEGRVGEEEEDEGEEGKRMDGKLVGGHQLGPP